MSDTDEHAEPAADAVLASLVDVARAAASPGRGLPPVERWNPPFCGDIDMRIMADGEWRYLGSPIRRPAMVRLFSTILRKDPERYVLVTPVERVGIIVEDAPFLAVDLRVEPSPQGRTLVLRTNVGDETRLGPEHALRAEQDAHGGLKPYAHVRGGLWAKLTRALAHDLAALGEIVEHDGRPTFGVRSSGVFFPLAPAEASDAEDGP